MRDLENRATNFRSFVGAPQAHGVSSVSRTSSNPDTPMQAKLPALRFHSFVERRRRMVSPIKKISNKQSAANNQ
jgi:hypothetical protein